MKFTLTIELGNDAMRPRAHIAEALRNIAAKLNGNRVGQWEVSQ